MIKQNLSIFINIQLLIIIVKLLLVYSNSN